MKIGILTLPLHSNYGGILQAYALQLVLERMGYNVIHLNGKMGKYYFPRWRLPLIYLKRLILKYLLFKKNIQIFFEEKNYKLNLLINRDIDKFINQYIHISNKELKRLPNNFVDIIIVGSDQIWRGSYKSNNLHNAYLKFAKKWDIKRIAYAPSFGKKELEYRNKDISVCKNLLKRFDAVSVREISGVILCKEYFNIDAELVLDPTMLLYVSDYTQLFDDIIREKEEGILYAYILDDHQEKNIIIEDLQKRYSLKINKISPEPGKNNTSKYMNARPSVEMWIKSFYDAKFIFTDSYHGCIFSILFNIPFIAFCNTNRGSDRFVSLLSSFNLESRMVYSSNDYFNKQIEEINWIRINKKLGDMRNHSLQFLTNALSL